MTTQVRKFGVIATLAVGFGAVAGAVGASVGPPQIAAVGYTLQAQLDPSQMVPTPASPVASSATGKFQGLLAQIPVYSRPPGHSLRIVWRLGWRLSASNLTGKVTKVEIGQGAKGQAGAKLVTLCAPCATTLRGVVDVTAAKARVLLANGAYVTASTTANSGGEIRGQLIRQVKSQTRGSIVGSVVRGPGVDPRSGGGGASVPVPGDPITAGPLAGPAVPVAVTAQDGSFRLSLPAGTYRIVEGICGVSARVNVQTAAVARVTLTIPNAC